MKQINRHLVTGFTYAVPLIILFSIVLAIDQNLWNLGSVPDLVFLCVIPVLTAAIASSVTAKILIVPGLILGVWMNQNGIGFFGGIIGGLILGYSTLHITQRIQLEQPLLVVLIGYLLIPAMTLGITYLLMEYVISIPILWLIDGVRSLVTSIDSSKTIMLVGVLAFFTVIDLGGPFNKLAFTFVLEFFVDGLYHITGPVIISVAIPPLSMLVLTYLVPSKVQSPSSSRKLLWVGALFGLTESAIPVILEDTIHRHPYVVIGSVTASVFAATMGLENILLMTSIPGLFGVNMIGVYLLAHIIGIGIIVGLVSIVTPRKSLHNDQDTV